GIQERIAEGDPLPESRIAEARRWIEARPDSVPHQVRQFVEASETAAETRMRELQEAREAAKTEAISRRLAINVGLVPIIRSVASGADAQTVLRLVVNTAAGLIGESQNVARVCYFELEAEPLRLVPVYHAGRDDKDAQGKIAQGGLPGIDGLIAK